MLLEDSESTNIEQFQLCVKADEREKSAKNRRRFHSLYLYVLSTLLLVIRARQVQRLSTDSRKT